MEDNCSMLSDLLPRKSCKHMSASVHGTIHGETERKPQGGFYVEENLVPLFGGVFPFCFKLVQRDSLAGTVH